MTRKSSLTFLDEEVKFYILSRFGWGSIGWCVWKPCTLFPLPSSLMWQKLVWLILHGSRSQATRLLPGAWLTGASFTTLSALLPVVVPDQVSFLYTSLLVDKRYALHLPFWNEWCVRWTEEKNSLYGLWRPVSQAIIQDSSDVLEHPSFLLLDSSYRHLFDISPGPLQWCCWRGMGDWNFSGWGCDWAVVGLSLLTISYCSVSEFWGVFPTHFSFPHCGWGADLPRLWVSPFIPPSTLFLILYGWVVGFAGLSLFPGVDTTVS